MTSEAATDGTHDGSNLNDEDDDNRTTGITNPRDTDVLCGRGGAALRHPGNQTYRRLVNINKGIYITCLKTEKLKISRSIVAAIRAQNGRFLEKDSGTDADGKGTWYDIGDKKAIEKTSQALREGQPKLRQKIAELGGGTITPTASGLATDINPHCLPYGATAAVVSGGSVHTTVSASAGAGSIAVNSFPGGSVHSMGSGTSFSMGESGILSATDGMSFRSGSYVGGMHSGGSVMSNNSHGMQAPPFLQQSFQDNAAFAAALQQQEFQVQANPHHRDIPLNNMAAPPNRQPKDLSQPDVMQRMSLQDMSVNSGNNGLQLLQSASALSGLGMSIRTVDSNAVNTVNTFNTMNTMNSIHSNNSGSQAQLRLQSDSQHQRLALARELGIDESQLSLLSALSPAHTNFGSLQSPTTMTSDMINVDNFKRNMMGTPLTDFSLNNIAESEIFNGFHNNAIGNNANSMPGSLNSYGNNKLDLAGTMGNGGNPQISHINIADINQSATSMITNHSAFDTNSTMSPLNRRTDSNYQQFVHQQRQQQQLLQQQQLIQQQQQQQLLLQQRQLQLQKKQQEQQQQLRMLQQQQQRMNQVAQSLPLEDGSDFNPHEISSLPSGNGMIASNNMGGMNNMDRRRAFATMKYVRPPSVRDPQPESIPLNLNHGQPINRQQTQKQQQPRPLAQQPEVTTIKISEGIHGRNKTNVSSAHDSGSSLGDITDFQMSESERSFCSNLSTMTLSDSKNLEENNKGDNAEGNNNKNRTASNTYKTNKVIVETTKVIDHSNAQTRTKDFGENAGSRRSLMSGLSMKSEASSIFSNLDDKIGNVSTRSVAMSEMSSVDHIDIDDEDDDDTNNAQYDDDHDRKVDEVGRPMPLIGGHGHDYG